MAALDFPAPSRLPNEQALRNEVRDFLKQEQELVRAGALGSWSRCCPEFSRRLGERGWIGMAWPRKYGGQERSALERYIVIEELLAANAPVGAHWTADRQCGPLLLYCGSEEQRLDILPRIAAGKCYIAIGLSEPGVGSDLASLKTRAAPVDGGYCLRGTKLWTTQAHISHYMTVLCRTDGEHSHRHEGLSQLIVDMASPGIEVRPIIDMTGSHSLNEVQFDDVFVPDNALIGTRGDGWKQVLNELSNERSAPDRILSSFKLLDQLVASVRSEPTEEGKREVGRLIGRTALLTSLSASIVEMQRLGRDPGASAAIVKDLGAELEQETPEIARKLFPLELSRGSDDYLQTLIGAILLMSPSFSVRGGTREILRGIIARSLGAR
ncbi:acyl-CoA dehydrogenase [Kineobactrum salinum]|uniref:Acyl-CoA dehydrogenase n=1 Tax=Kineobactrum salinum TaxID=2708301 RepID=A0A6C0U6H7_9GAMM|nr:acyl-CoA dehydrogenase [Kineobactrum salinum]